MSQSQSQDHAQQNNEPFANYAQQQLYLTQRDLAKTRYDTIMNSLRLKSAAGTLQEKDIVQINTILVEPAQR